MEGLAWLSRRQRDGSIDRIPMPDSVPGALWLCGKHAIGPDHSKLIDEVGGAATVVCLVERHELEDRYPEYLDWLQRPSTADAVWFPIPDLHAPDLARVTPFVDELVTRLTQGETLVVHCAGGMGRAGTIAVCVLNRLGVPLDEALATVAVARPGAGPEVGAQRDLVEQLAQLGRMDDDVR
jgi:protein-tyrosine phosphatase